MVRLKNSIVAGLVLLTGLFVLTSCSNLIRPHSSGGTSETAQISREPLDVKKITYLVYYGGLLKVDMYIITSDLKAEKYSINPEPDKHYDYLAGELTGVNFMELDEDMSTKDIIDDGASYYIMVETTDAKNISGGYVAGYDDDSDSRRFEEARQIIESTIKDR